MWQFTKKEGWVKIDSLFSTPVGGSLENELRTHGYHTSPDLMIGDVEACGIDVYRSTEDVAYDYLVSIGIGNSVQWIAIPELPDLLGLLGEITPVASQICAGAVTERWK